MLKNSRLAAKYSISIIDVCVTNDHGYVQFDVITIPSFFTLITKSNTMSTTSEAEHDMLTVLEHLFCYLYLFCRILVSNAIGSMRNTMGSSIGAGTTLLFKSTAIILSFWVVICPPLFLSSAIVLSVLLRIVASDDPFDIFKIVFQLGLKLCGRILLMVMCTRCNIM